MKKVISGIVFIAFLIVLGITDCPICNEIICKCDTVQAQEVPQKAQNEPLSEETEEVDVTVMIRRECEKQGIDSDIPLAIARLETGHYTSKAFLEGNNVGGISVNEVPLEYETLEEGVQEFVRILNEYYYKQGLTTVEAIGKKYCPANAETWISLVNKLREVD